MATKKQASSRTNAKKATAKKSPAKKTARKTARKRTVKVDEHKRRPPRRTAKKAQPDRAAARADLAEQLRTRGRCKSTIPGVARCELAAGHAGDHEATAPSAIAWDKPTEFRQVKS